jgi:DNA polymerase III psi subunit
MNRVLSSRQLAYLDAMGIGAWRLRETGPADVFDPENAPGLRLCTGSGGVLLVCNTDTDSASRLANDINRTLGNVPAWAWPAADADAVKIEDAVEENLFTTVVFFGSGLAELFFGPQFPSHLNSAEFVLLPSLQELHDQSKARQVLWRTFCRSGLVTSRDSTT